MRRYEKAFVAKLSDFECEAADPPAGGWLDFLHDLNYIVPEICMKYNKINLFPST
jgi:hypothetical protein